MDPLLIGITCDFSPAEQDRDPRFFLKTSYVSYMKDKGIRVVLLPFIPPFVPSEWAFLDGIVLSGSGSDIPPDYYGETKTFLPGNWMSDDRVKFEFSLLELSLEEKIPVFGICGGFQTMNVYKGGSLVQDLPSMRPDGLVHQKTAHDVDLKGDLRLLWEQSGSSVKHSKVRVNSFHHQGVERLGSGLEVEATTEDELIEGFRDPEHPFFVGVQWHPERMPEEDSFSQGLRNSFLTACRSRQSKKR